MQEPINGERDSIKEVREPINRVQESIKEVQELINEVQDSINGVQVLINEVRYPINELQPLINEVRDLINKNRIPIKEIKESINEVRDSINEVREAINKLRDYPNKKPPTRIDPSVATFQHSNPIINQYAKQMNKQQANHFRMFLSTQSFLDTNASVWNGISRMVNYKNMFDEIISRIQAKSESTRQGVGVTQQKEQLKEAIATKASMLSGILQIIATEQNNSDMASAVKMTKSNLTLSKEADIGAAVKNLIAKANENTTTGFLFIKNFNLYFFELNAMPF